MRTAHVLCGADLPTNWGWPAALPRSGGVPPECVSQCELHPPRGTSRSYVATDLRNHHRTGGGLRNSRYQPSDGAAASSSPDDTDGDLEHIAKPLKAHGAPGRSSRPLSTAAHLMVGFCGNHARTPPRAVAANQRVQGRPSGTHPGRRSPLEARQVPEQGGAKQTVTEERYCFRRREVTDGVACGDAAGGCKAWG